MSHSGKPISELELSDGVRDSLSCCDDDDNKKPDFRELDLGSPISPLRPPVPTTSSSSSSSISSGSSGSVSRRTGPNPVPKRSDSGETNSPTRTIKPGHKRYDSHPLIYSGQTQRSSPSPSSSSSPSVVNSRPVTVLPAGNICPSGRILKAGMATPRGSRTDVLGSGTGNYGHGSIMRGGKGQAAIDGAGNPNTGGGGIEGAKRVAGNVDPEELKRAGNEEYKRGHFVEALCLYDRAIAMSPGNAAYRSHRAAALTGLGRLAEAVRECEEAIRLDPNYGRAHQRLATLSLR